MIHHIQTRCQVFYLTVKQLHWQSYIQQLSENIITKSSLEPLKKPRKYANESLPPNEDVDNGY